MHSESIMKKWSGLIRIQSLGREVNDKAAFGGMVYYLRVIKSINLIFS